MIIKLTLNIQINTKYEIISLGNYCSINICWYGISSFSSNVNRIFRNNTKLIGLIGKVWILILVKLTASVPEKKNRKLTQIFN